jgi:hypothetical protein
MVYVKLTTKYGVHNGYRYKEGLNCLDGKFNSDNICGSGGLYFCDEKDIGKWISYSDKVMYYIWDVTLLDDSKLVDMGDKLKTDKFILQNKRTIWDDNELCKLAVQQNGDFFRFVKNQTEEICKLAVQEKCCALMYVEEQTEEICKLAVQNNYLALQYIKNQTEEICKLAVQHYGEALKFVREQTEEICKLAVQQNGHALRWVKNQTEEICKLAVQNNRYSFKFVKNQTEEICKLAVHLDG